MRKSSSSDRSKKRVSNPARGQSGLFMAQRTTMKSFYRTVQSQKVSGLGKNRALVETALVVDGTNNRCHSDHAISLPMPAGLQISNNNNKQTTPVSCDKYHAPTTHRSGEGPHDDARAPKRQKASSPKQMYLDLGQRDFGKQTICDTCGMLCVHGLSEDAREHQKTCRDFLHGVTFSAKNARVVARGKQGVIVEVRPQLGSYGHTIVSCNDYMV